MSINNLLDHIHCHLRYPRPPPQIQKTAQLELGQIMKAKKNAVELKGIQAAHLRDSTAIIKFIKWFMQTDFRMLCIILPFHYLRVNELFYGLKTKGGMIALSQEFPDWPTPSKKKWLTDYLSWEITLLEELGFGLDLSSCAVTGVLDNLKYISPRSGRAVSLEAAGDWSKRLLPLPNCLRGFDDGIEDLIQGFLVTGYFLENKVASSLGQKV